MSDDLLERMNNARDFPANTCGASRHAAMIAEALCKGEEYPMLAEEPDHCGESIAATVAALWECRAKLAKVIRLADAMAKAIEDQISLCDASMDEQIAVKNYRTTLAELTGGKDG